MQLKNVLKSCSFLVSVFLLAVIFGCEKEDVVDKKPGISSTVEDIEGNIYEIVKIGDQVWMAENLRVTSYNDGTSIPTGLSPYEWSTTTEGAYDVFPHDYEDWPTEGIDSEEEMLDAYGALYNWFAVDNSRGLCPEGWYVPDDQDWQELVNYIFGDGKDGNALKSCRQVNSPLGNEYDTKEHPRWSKPQNIEQYGTDDYGFSALPGGYRYYYGTYSLIGYSGFWWSSSEFETEESVNGLLRYMHHYSNRVMWIDGGKRYGFSVRCIKDEE